MNTGCNQKFIIPKYSAKQMQGHIVPVKMIDTYSDNFYDRGDEAQ